MTTRTKALSISALALSIIAFPHAAAAAEPTPAPATELFASTLDDYTLTPATDLVVTIAAKPAASGKQTYTAPAETIPAHASLDRESYSAELQPRLSHPVGGSPISSSYGPRVCESGPCTTFHEGVDYAAGTGSPVHPVARGTVVSAGYEGNFGNKVVIDHNVNGEHFVTIYAHMDFISVHTGQSVERSDQIGGVGNTGRSYGAHLHFELRPNGGSSVNPIAWLDARGVLPFPG
jgi:murein DD-endopeptidase MepM/ murein hydrolase activator NlpD